MNYLIRIRLFGKFEIYMAYLVARGHSPIKVKRAVKNVGKMTRASF